MSEIFGLYTVISKLYVPWARWTQPGPTLTMGTREGHSLAPNQLCGGMEGCAASPQSDPAAQEGGGT